MVRALGAVFLAVILLIGGAAAMAGQPGASGANTTTTTPADAALSGDDIPAEYKDLITAAGERCPEISAPVLAAVISVESDWNPNAVNSRTGARGLGQFLATTWAQYGVDGNKDGRTDAADPADAIPAIANYLCAMVPHVKPVAAKSKTPLTDLLLAAYHAGAGAVQKAGGIPNGSDGGSTTKAYVKKITERAKNKYTKPKTPNDPPAGGPALTGECPLDELHAPRKPNPHDCNEAIAYMASGANGGSYGLINGRCLAIVALAYGWNASGVYTAAQHARLLVAAGQMRSDRNPPRGAVLWWVPITGIGPGHVAIYGGNGQIWSTDRPEDGKIGAVAFDDMVPWTGTPGLSNRYIGWTAPYFPNAG